MTFAGTPLSLALTGADPEGDPLTYAVVGLPSHGLLTGTPPNVTYTPNGGYIGPDSFTFKANDTLNDSPLATVSLTDNPLPIGSFGILQSGFTRNALTRHYFQTVTLAHSGGGPIPGPVSLILDGLPAGITLVHPSGTTSATTPSGSSYVNANVGADNALTSGETATVTLEFVNPNNLKIAYALRVLTGPDPR
jgi:hypothetical protein